MRCTHLMRVLVPKSLLYFTFILVELLQLQASLTTISDNVTQTVEIYLNFYDGSIPLSLKRIILTEYIVWYAAICMFMFLLKYLKTFFF